MTATTRRHIADARACLTTEDPHDTTRAIAHALVAIAITLEDMADEEANTAPQPRVDPKEYWRTDPRVNLNVGSYVRDVDLASPADGKNPE